MSKCETMNELMNQVGTELLGQLKTIQHIFQTLFTVHHWAVQVGNTWYEIDGDFGEKNGDRKVNKIATTHGKVAKSGACSLVGEFVGKTTKSDEEIENFYREWVSNNPTYDVFSENCQKFAIDLIR